jgi:hypothetical protein
LQRRQHSLSPAAERLKAAFVAAMRPENAGASALGRT